MKKILFITFILLGFFGTAQADTFGPEGVGGSSSNSGVIICASSTPASSGTITLMTQIVNSAAATLVGVAVYSVDGANGRPDALLASNAPSGDAMPGTKSSVTSAITQAITAGTGYYLCSWANASPSTRTYYYDSTAGYNIVFASAAPAWETWPATFPYGGIVTSRRMAIYATYTPSGGASSFSYSIAQILGKLQILGNLIIR